MIDLNATSYLKPSEPTTGINKKGFAYVGFTYPKTEQQIKEETIKNMENKIKQPNKDLKNYINGYIEFDGQKINVITEEKEEYKKQNFRYELTPKENTFSTEGIKQILRKELNNINVKTLFELIIKEIKKYCYLKQEAEYYIIAIYIMLTYKYQHLDFISILHLHGDSGTGKSQIGKIMYKLSFNSSATISTSKSSFFRRIDRRRGLYFMDEKEHLEEFEKELLNGCTYEGNIHTITEKKGDEFIDTDFQIYTPVILACISDVYGATSTRMIKIETVKPPRKTKKYVLIRLTQEKVEWNDIKNKLVLWSITTSKENETLLITDEKMENLLSNRGVDNWKCILNQSKILGVYEVITEYIEGYYKDQIEDLQESDLSLSFLKFLVNFKNVDWIKSNELYNEFKNGLNDKQQTYFTVTRFGKLMRKIGYFKGKGNKKRTPEGHIYKLDSKLTEIYIKNNYEFTEELMITEEKDVLKEEIIGG